MITIRPNPGKAAKPPPPIPPRPSKTIVAEALAKTRKLPPNQNQNHVIVKSQSYSALNNYARIVKIDDTDPNRARLFEEDPVKANIKTRTLVYQSSNSKNQDAKSGNIAEIKVNIGRSSSLKRISGPSNRISTFKVYHANEQMRDDQERETLKFNQFKINDELKRNQLLNSNSKQLDVESGLKSNNQLKPNQNNKADTFSSDNLNSNQIENKNHLTSNRIESCSANNLNPKNVGDQIFKSHHTFKVESFGGNHFESNNQFKSKQYVTVSTDKPKLIVSDKEITCSNVDLNRNSQFKTNCSGQDVTKNQLNTNNNLLKDNEQLKSNEQQEISNQERNSLQGSLQTKATENYMNDRTVETNGQSTNKQNVDVMNDECVDSKKIQDDSIQAGVLLNDDNELDKHLIDINDRNHVNTLIDEMFASVLELQNEKTGIVEVYNEKIVARKHFQTNEKSDKQLGADSQEEIELRREKDVRDDCEGHHQNSKIVDDGGISPGVQGTVVVDVVNDESVRVLQGNADVNVRRNVEQVSVSQVEMLQGSGKQEGKVETAQHDLEQVSVLNEHLESERNAQIKSENLEQVRVVHEHSDYLQEIQLPPKQIDLQRISKSDIDKVNIFEGIVPQENDPHKNQIYTIDQYEQTVGQIRENGNQIRNDNTAIQHDGNDLTRSVVDQTASELDASEHFKRTVLVIDENADKNVRFTDIRRSKSSSSTSERRKKIDDQLNHELLISELAGMKRDQERIAKRDREERILRRQRKPSLDIYECESKIHTSDWVEVNDGQEIRLSSCQITIENGYNEMSNLHGLPPLPKSLSGFNLIESSPQTPGRPGSSSSRNVSPAGYPAPYPSHQTAAPNGEHVVGSLKKGGNLEAKLALLRREMYSLRQLDLSLLSQLWSLNESIQDFRHMLQEQDDRNVLSPPSPSPTPSSGDDADGDEFYAPSPMRFRPAPPPPPHRRPSNSSTGTGSSV